MTEEKDVAEYEWDDDVSVETINIKEGTVTLTNGYCFTHKKWYERFVNFWDKKIIGKTIVPTFYEYLFARGGSHQYAQLVKGKQHEGFLLGQMGKPIMSKERAIAVGTIIVLSFVGVILLVILKSQGMLPGFGG